MEYKYISTIVSDYKGLKANVIIKKIILNLEEIEDL